MKSFVLATFFLLSAFSGFAQINADREFVKKHKIESAWIQDGQPLVGITFYYDHDGRLTRSIQINWLSNPGSSDVIYYDTLGRWIALLAYTVSDSTQLLHPELLYLPEVATHWIYSGDSVEITIDSTWDFMHRLLDVRREEVNRTIEKMPPPPAFRPVFWCDAYISKEIDFWNLETYIYIDSDMKPDTVLRNGSVTMSSCVLKNDRFVTETFSESFYKDSATFTRAWNIITLHGKADTITCSYNTCRTVPENTECAGFPLSKPSTGYVVAKKYFGKYHIKYNLFGGHHFEWRKVANKEPWHSSSFSFWSFMYNKDEVNDYETIANYSKMWGAKPVYTYWQK